jgi:hypothetical protein
MGKWKGQVKKNCQFEVFKTTSGLLRR